MHLPVTYVICLCSPAHVYSMYVTPWHMNIYETAGWCGMSSNVYTDHVSITDRPKGKPSDVDLCASPNSYGQTAVFCIWLNLNLYS